MARRLKVAGKVAVSVNPQASSSSRIVLLIWPPVSALAGCDLAVWQLAPFWEYLSKNVIHLRARSAEFCLPVGHYPHRSYRPLADFCQAEQSITVAIIESLHYSQCFSLGSHSFENGYSLESLGYSLRRNWGLSQLFCCPCDWVPSQLSSCPSAKYYSPPRLFVIKVACNDIWFPNVTEVNIMDNVTSGAG